MADCNVSVSLGQKSLKIVRIDNYAHIVLNGVTEIKNN